MEKKEAIEIVRKLYNESLFLKKDKEAIVTLIPELEDSEDELLMKELINAFKEATDSLYMVLTPSKREAFIAWLEKQELKSNPYSGVSFNYNGNTWGMCARDNGVDILFNRKLIQHISDEKQGEQKFEQKFFINDKVVHKATGKIWTIHYYLKDTNSYYVEDNDGLLHHYIESELKLVEQKSAKVEPKFHEGEWVVTDFDNVVRIKAIENGLYVFENSMRFSIGYVDKCWRKWCISDVKDGDVLVYNNGCVEIILLFKKWCREVGKGAYNYAHMTSSGHYAYINNWSDCGLSAHPATKEQRDTLMKAMTDAGYTFDFEKKELKKIEQKPECSEDNWSEEDEKMLEDIVSSINHESVIEGLKCRGINYSLDTSARLMENLINWLKSLKDRVQPQPQQQWKPTEEQMDALLYIFRHYAPTTTDKLAWDALQTLEFMLAQLKKLKG